jgi:glutathione S-transferase
VLLIGMFDSPYVRRVAVSMMLLDIKFEHGNWSVGRDFDRIRQYSPLGRVPTLVLDDDEVLSDSAAILDFLDDRVGRERALLPPTGKPRSDALKIMTMATGAADKGRDQIYERVFRPPAKRHEEWLDRLKLQMHGALGEIEHHCESRADEQWLIASSMTQADISVTCAFTFLNEALPDAAIAARYPRVGKLAARCELLAPFKSTHVPFFTPSGAA